MNRLTAIILLMVACTASNVAFSQIVDCQDEIEESCVVLAGKPGYPVITPSEGIGIGDDDSCMVDCIPFASPPPRPQLSCMSDGMNYYCIVWPQGPGLTYLWSASPHVQLSIPGVNPTPYQRITCNSSGTFGAIVVEAIAPNGLRSTQNFSVSCLETIIGIGIEEPPQNEKQ